jgi:hypothetical protein
MKTIAIKVMLVSVALGASVFALAGTASAIHVTAEIRTPGEATVGRPAEVQARLRTADAGAPVAGTSVTFFTDASFAGVSGEVELGRAVTDENGVATLTFEPRTASAQEIRIEYLPPGEDEPKVAKTAISVVDGESQLHRSTSGISIPGLNVWAIMALVGTVWAILLSVALRVIAIARASDDTDVVFETAHASGHSANQSGVSGVR